MTATKQRGRPKGSATTGRSKASGGVSLCHVTREERDAIKARARARGMSVAGYVVEASAALADADGCDKGEA